MRFITKTVVSCLAGLLGIAACGEPAAPDGSGGAGGGDGSGAASAVGGTSSGGSASGGASSGGASSGGSSSGGEAGSTGDGGQTGTGGAAAGAHCAPGETMSGPFAYLGEMLSNCGTIAGEVGSDQLVARSIDLGTTIGPGDTIAFSADVATQAATMEFWGATEECGDGLELLAKTVMQSGINCVEFAPQNGTYSHISWVWKAYASHGDVTLCLEGSCGP